VPGRGGGIALRRLNLTKRKRKGNILCTEKGLGQSNREEKRGTGDPFAGRELSSGKSLIYAVTTKRVKKIKLWFSRCSGSPREKKGIGKRGKKGDLPSAPAKRGVRKSEINWKGGKRGVRGCSKKIAKEATTPGGIGEKKGPDRKRGREGSSRLRDGLRIVPRKMERSGSFRAVAGTEVEEKMAGDQKKERGRKEGRIQKPMNRHNSGYEKPREFKQIRERTIYDDADRKNVGGKELRSRGRREG